MFISLEEVKGWNLYAKIHFCEHCGHISIGFLKHELAIVFYATKHKDEDYE